MKSLKPGLLLRHKHKHKHSFSKDDQNTSISTSRTIFLFFLYLRISQKRMRCCKLKSQSAILFCYIQEVWNRSTLRMPTCLNLRSGRSHYRFACACVIVNTRLCRSRSICQYIGVRSFPPLKVESLQEKFSVVIHLQTRKIRRLRKVSCSVNADSKPYFNLLKAFIWEGSCCRKQFFLFSSSDQLYSHFMLIYRRALFIMLDSLQNEEPEIR